MKAPASLLVLGTDTGVGKTVVSALLIRTFQARGHSASPFKPIACGAEGARGEEFWPDIAFLAQASGVDESDIGQYRLTKPLSPHLAAAGDGVHIDPKLITEKLRELRARYDTVIVEGVGGVMTPLTSETVFLDLAVEIDLPVVIVTRPGLGTLNHTLLTVEACRDRGLDIIGLVVNRFPATPDEAEASNPSELAELTSLPVIAIVPELGVSVSELNTAGLDEGVDLINFAAADIRRPDYAEAVDADAKYLWHPFSQMTEYLSEKPHPLMIVKARGCRLEDSDGRRYIDGTASLWVNVHGHRQKDLDRAVRTQLSKVAHTTLLGLGNEPAALLAKELVDVTPGDFRKVFYSDNGSTAVEIALKVAFQYWRQTGRPEKTEFVSFTNAYHGDTIGAVSVGGHDVFQAIFKPLLFPAHLTPSAYCYRCPVGTSYPGCDFACLGPFEEILKTRGELIAAVICEPKVQGAAGILVQPPGYLKKIAALCLEYRVLLIADEVATGFGRTGELFACDHEGVEPDILCLAKGMTGGYLPLAATLFHGNIYDAFLGPYEELKTFFHGHTYTGNPLACATALANLALIDKPGFLAGIRLKEEALAGFLSPLNSLKHVGDVRQCGLMTGIELVADKATAKPFPVEDRIGRQVILKARDRGVIIRPLGDTVVLMPPLGIGLRDLEELAAATIRSISEVTNDL